MNADDSTGPMTFSSSIPVCPKNCAETDASIGRIRMLRLIPYARARLGQSMAGGSDADVYVRLSLRRDMKQLTKDLACGAEKLRSWVHYICESGIENVRVSDFLKSAPSGGKGKCKIRQIVRAPMQDAINEVCVNQGITPGSRAATKRIRAEMERLGVPKNQQPSPRALKSAATAPDIVTAHTASVAGEHMCRVLGVNTEAMKINEVVLIDATTHSSDSDVAECLYAVDEFDRVLGLVNAIYGIDAATRGVWTALGYVGAANTFLAGLSIHRGLLDKGPLLAKYGICGAWPWCGKPSRLVTDRGSEFVGKRIKGTLDEIGIGFVDKSPPVSPYYKAKVERFNRTAHTLFTDFLRSEVGRKYFRPVKGKQGATGILFRDLDRAMLEWVVSIYHARGHKGLGGSSPLDRFNDIANGLRGFPLSGPPVAVADRPDLMWDFLWEEHRVINHVGISIFNRTYNDSNNGKNSALTQFLAPGTRSSIKRNSTRFNPYALGQVFVRRADTGEIFKIPYTPKNDVLPMTLDQARQAINPSLWEWRTAYTDLKRVGIEKPTPGQMSEVIQAREEKILNPSVSISGVLTQRDVSNLQMRVAFASAQPVATTRPPPTIPNKTALNRKTLQPATLLPTGRGGADEY